MITKDDVLEHADTVVDALNLLATVTHNHTAEVIARVARGVVTALTAKAKGVDVDVDQVLAELREGLAGNDAAADAALAERFKDRA